MKGESKEIIDLIRSDYESREKALKTLYVRKDLRNSIMKMLLSSGGQKQDLSLILNESLVRFYKNCIAEKSLKIEGDLTGYITGIARYCWYQMLKKRKINIPIDELNISEIDEQNQEELIFLKEQRDLLKQILKQLGKNCREVLMYWSYSFSMKEIAVKLGYKSPGMAKKKKHQCLKQLVGYIEENPEFKKELMN